jgi:DNA-binding transcriptional ArsR family regulator
MMGIDRDDILQACEIALGDTLGHETDARRAVREADVTRLARRLLRVLAELPGETMACEIIEALEE